MCIPVIWFPVDIPNGAQPLDGYDCFLLWFCENPRILKFLSFSAFLQVSNESLRSLSTLENLEEISMVGCLFIDDDGLQMLGAGNSLQVITLQGCRSLYDPLCILWCHFLLFIYFFVLIAFSTSSVPDYWCIKVSPRDFSGLSFTHRQSKIYPKNKCWTQFACECSSFALCFLRTNDANDDIT